MTYEYAVLWDVDGTLVDTAAQHFGAWQRLAADLGKEFTQADFTATFGRRNPEILTELFGADLSPQRIDELGYQKEEYYREVARDGIAPLPGVMALLQGLHEAGFGQAICSSGPQQNLKLILDLIGAAQYFGAVVGMEDTTRGKPDPEVFLLGAERLGVAPAHCLVMEDAPAGIEGAKAGGMKALGITFVGHHSLERLRAAGADEVVHTFEEVDVARVRQILGA